MNYNELKIFRNILLRVDRVQGIANLGLSAVPAVFFLKSKFRTIKYLQIMYLLFKNFREIALKAFIFQFQFCSNPGLSCPRVSACEMQQKYNQAKIGRIFNVYTG